MKLHTLTGEQFDTLKRVSREGRVYIPIMGIPGIYDLEEAGLVAIDGEKQTFVDRGVDRSYHDYFATITDEGRAMLAKSLEREAAEKARNRERWAR